MLILSLAGGSNSLYFLYFLKDTDAVIVYGIGVIFILFLGGIVGWPDSPHLDLIKGRRTLTGRRTEDGVY